jgi:methyl-accepting chemotaxis protein
MFSFFKVPNERSVELHELRAIMKAIDKSQAIIQFSLDGTIIDANENFLKTLGYNLDEVKGHHHKIFVDREYENTIEYREFWNRLGGGEYQSGEFRRIDKNGKYVWIQASYNPIFGLDGKPYKIVKYAYDITKQTQRRIELQSFSHRFQDRVHGIIGSVAEASTQLAHTAESMKKTISESNLNVKDAVTNTAETYQSVQSVAAAAEEMSATIQEISAQTQNANNLISESVEKVKGADNHAGELRVASQKVKSVIQLISNISSQINLLALNATIESARAGEAGKGFAVVANEVRNLAGQTDKSIQEIEKVIGDMSNASDNVIVSLGSIKEAVDKIYVSSCGIASAVEEQSAVMNDIAQNMNIATHKTQSVKENVTIVGTLSSEAESSSQQVLSAAQELSCQSVQLDKEVTTFLNEIITE